MDDTMPTPPLEPVLRSMSHVSVQSYRGLVWGMAVCMVQDTLLLTIFLFATMQQAGIVRHISFLDLMICAMVINLVAIGSFFYALRRYTHPED